MMSSYSEFIRNLKIAARVLGVWLLVAAWWGSLLVDPIYVQPTITREHVFYISVISIILILLGSFKIGTEKHKKTPSLWIVPICILIACSIIGEIFYGPSLQTFLMLSIALLLATNFSKLGFLKRFALIITLILFGLQFCTLIMEFTRSYPELISCYLAPQASFILNALGYNTASVNGFVIYQSHRVFCDMIKSGFYLAVGFCVGFIALLLESKIINKKKWILLALGIGLHYVIMLIYLVFVVLTIPPFAYTGVDQIHEFYWTKVLIFFFGLTPIWFLIFKKFALEEGIDLNLLSQPDVNRSYILAGFLLFLSIFSMFAMYNFYGFKDSTDTIIIFDEIHSDWEPTTMDYNTTYFGVLADNNYHLFADYISKFYPVYILSDRNISLPLDNARLVYAQKIDEKLLEFDGKKVILVLKCPTKPLSAEEVETVLNFVREGGSLLLIGDHTDVYLMNTYLNKISKYFGITFNFDALYMVEGGWIFTNRNDYIQHPTTHYLDEFLWATGCSLSIRPPARAVAFSPFTSFNDIGDYHNEFFFGDGRINPNEIYGSFPVMAVSEYGKGKVFAFTDSTCFSNPLMFTPGKRELIMGVISWLGCSNNFNPFGMLFALSFIGFLLVVLKLRVKCLATLLLLLLITGPIAGISGTSIAFYLNERIYKFPNPIHALPPQILFDDSHRSEHCIALGNTSSVMGDDSYSIFYSWVGRLGMYPSLNYKHPLTRSMLENYDALVIISPRRNFSKEELNAIQVFVKNGGGLLLIEGASQKSTINEVASIFNLTFDLKPAQAETSYLGYANPTEIYGGIAMKNVPFASYVRYGEGIVIALGDDLLLTNQNLTPNRSEWRLLVGALVNRTI